VLVYLFCRKKWKRANNTMLFSCVVSVLDVATDWFFVLSLSGNSDTQLAFYITLTSLVTAIIVNGLLSACWILKPEFKREEFSDWVGDNTAGFAVAFLLSLTNIDALRILWSEMFYATVFSAPVTRATDRNARIGSLAGTLIEDLPQLAVQVWLAIKTGVVNKLLAASMTITAIKLVFDVARRCLYAKYKNQKDLKQLSRESQYVSRMCDVPLELWTKEQILEWKASARSQLLASLTHLEELEQLVNSENLTGVSLQKAIKSSGQLPGGLFVQKIGKDTFCMPVRLIHDASQTSPELEMTQIPPPYTNSTSTTSSSVEKKDIESALPGNWRKFLDKNGRPYYHDQTSGKTLWERPTA